MPELRIEREHRLTPDEALAMAQRWVQEAERDWGLSCQGPQPLDEGPTWTFERPGVSGQLQLQPQRFVLQLQLGFLLSAYASRMERHIRDNLDALLGPA